MHLTPNEASRRHPISWSAGLFEGVGRIKGEGRKMSVTKSRACVEPMLARL
jgi:hypothetical protein